MAPGGGTKGDGLQILPKMAGDDSRREAVRPLPDEVGVYVPDESAGGRVSSAQVRANRRWREKNREKYNAYMRVYRKRLKEKR